MRKKECYVCAYCNKVWWEAGEAMDCEKTHANKETLQIKDVTEYDRTCRFPNKVLVKDTEHKEQVAEYTLSRIVNPDENYDIPSETGAVSVKGSNEIKS